MAVAAPFIPLSALDRAFLWLDRTVQPFHVAYLGLLTPPREAGDGFAAQLAARLRAGPAPTAPFNRRLVWRRGVQTWLEDPEFDPEQHLVHLTLPRPGRREQLVALAARLHGVHLDRAFPLWRLYLISGLADGRIAVYCKVHHALADGMSATRLLLQSMSTDPLAERPPPWAPPVQGPKAHAAARSPRLRDVLHSIHAVWSEMRLASREAQAGEVDAVGGDEAPSSILNQRISSTRQFAARSLPLPRIQALGRALGATTNDVVLALCAAALRHFLLELRALPDASLIAMVPMSIREPGDRGAGNQIVPLLVRLGTDVAEPLRRLRVIRQSAERSKARCRALGMGEAYAYLLATSGPSALRLLLQPRAGRLPFNVVLSNISGASGTQYWQGCRVDGLYPMSVVVDGLALNLTFASQGDQLDFGCVACRRSLPAVGRLLDHLEAALAELEARVPRPESVPREIHVPRRRRLAKPSRRETAAPAANDGAGHGSRELPAV